MKDATTKSQDTLYEIEEINFVHYTRDMIDIEVEGDHTFYISENPDADFVLTHNTSWPDIDTDAGDRDELINAARELYGNDAVIPVSNFNTLKLKSLVKDIAKFYDIPFDEVNKVTGPLQEQVMQLAMDKNQEKSVFVLKHEDCMKYSVEYNEFMTKYPEVAEHVETLFMQNRAIGRHAGGVIIADADKLEQSMPIVGVRGELQTPWTEGMNFRNLEDNGFLKFDFLGLTLLKDVENCIYRILKKKGNENPTFLDARSFFDKHLNCRYVKQDDLKVWEHVYKNGRFCGIFQFTAPGARNFAIEAEPDSIEELAALTAIYRPGPLKANVHKKYVKAKRNVADIKYDHPIIEKILGPTYNYVVFQEQFMLLAQELSGFNPGEADKLRKTLVKKSLDTLHSKGSEKAIAREKFIKGAKELNDVPEHISSKLWADIENFAVYGFNKSLLFNTLVDTYDYNGNYLETKEIKDVIPGVYVKSRDEETKEDIFTQVLANHDHGEVPTFKITLEDGQSVECTMHHKFRVEDGRMLPLWYIIQEDLSIVCVEKVLQTTPV